MSLEPFLSKEYGDDEELQDLALSSSVEQRKTRWPIRPAALGFHLVLVALYTVLFFSMLHYMAEKYKNGPDLVHSPAQVAFSYERKYIKNDVHAENIYKGPPTPELDDAWYDLFQYNNIRVTKAELDRMNRTSVQLADGSGDYLVALDVYHHLHCVKIIRHYLHPEYYEIPHSINVKPEEHIDHCLDAIRQELMCRAEVTLTTYEWLPDVPIPWAQLSYDHTCANFEAIQEWSKSRVIDIFDPKYLVHPTRGPSYPNGA